MILMENQHVDGGQKEWDLVRIFRSAGFHALAIPLSARQHHIAQESLPKIIVTNSSPAPEPDTVFALAISSRPLFRRPHYAPNKRALRMSFVHTP